MLPAQEAFSFCAKHIEVLCAEGTLPYRQRYNFYPVPFIFYSLEKLSIGGVLILFGVENIPRFPRKGLNALCELCIFR